MQDSDETPAPDSGVHTQTCDANFLSQLVASSGDSIIAVGLDTRVVSWNLAAERLYGWTASEMIGQSIDRLFVEEDLNETQEIPRAILAGKPIPPHRVHRRHKDGHLVEVELTITPVRDHEGTILAIAGVSRDMSMRRQLEEERARRAANLAETRVLQQSNRSLEQFATTAAHDLKSPLNAIRTIAGFILDDQDNQLSDTSRTFLGELSRRSDMLAATIDGLLSFSRASAAAEIAETTDCQALIDEITQSLATDDHVAIAVTSTMPVINTAKFALQTVLSNLINNAIVHGDQAETHIQISAYSTDSAVVFQILDDGPGIEQKYHERILIPFRKLVSTDAHIGPGLGLTIVKRILDNVGGAIAIDSPLAQNRGTAIRVTWPRLWPERSS